MPVHNKKRPVEGKSQRPAKKQKKQKKQYKSDDEAPDFDPVNLLDSDDDIHNATIDQAAPSDDEASSSDDERPAPKKKMTAASKKKATKDPQPQEEEAAEEEQPSSSEDDDEDESEGDEFDIEGDDKSEDKSTQSRNSKKKDNSAFAKSLSAILSTKLTSSKRSDPVLSRSLEAQEASRALLDNALEAKARKQIRDQKRRAQEKGRVKDVLVATRNESTGEIESSTADVMETERRLRKVAQRGVVKLFNAVRAAQVAAVEAEKGVRKEGIIGMDRRGEKVNDMTKKGFLDLIASGGGGLSKNALEEA